MHYAQEVAPRGNIVAFTRSEAAAGLFDEATCQKVAAWYRDRENAGEFTFEQVPASSGAKADEPKPAKVPDVKARTKADEPKPAARPQGEGQKK